MIMRGYFPITIKPISQNRSHCVLVIFLNILNLHENHRRINIWNKIC